MAALVYLMLASLDGYAADEHGRFDWAAPDDEVHAFVNDLARSIGTHLYGRRMYEVMRAWETLESVRSERTRVERDFDPEAIRQAKAASDADWSVGGPHLAAEAFRAGLVDEIHLFLVPVAVGGGTRALPDDVRLELELLAERRFGNGTVFLRYRVLR